jgi:predicted O-methyltransferase YrrM
MESKYVEVMAGVKDTKKYPEIINGVAGHLTRPEAEWLRRIPQVLGSAMYAELGTFRGRSAVLLASSKIRLVSVDTFDQCNLRDEYKFHGGPIYDDVVNTLKARGLEDYVELVIADTATAALSYPDGSFIFLFIDADHSYEGVKRDFLAWQSKIAEGGIIAFHDSGRKEIVQFHSEIVGWEEFDRVDALSVWRRNA